MAEMEKDALWERYADLHEQEIPSYRPAGSELDVLCLHALVTAQRAEARREAARECLECIVRDGQDDDQADDTYGAARWTARQNIARDIRSRFHLDAREEAELKPGDMDEDGFTCTTEEGLS